MLDWLFGRKKQQPPKKSKKEKEDNKWKFDLLVQFLCGPEWKTTLLNFVDQNCIVFDNEEENKFAYTEVHNEFKKLVAGLFDSMMKDIGLEEEQLVQLIAKGLQSKNKKLFQQLLICDDFLKFKEIMVKRNKTLQQQAVASLLQQGTKSTLIDKPQHYVPNRGSYNSKKTPQDLEEQMIRKVIQESQRDERQRIAKVNAQQFEQVRKIQQTSALRESQKLQQQKVRRKEQMEKQHLQQQYKKKKQEQRMRIEMQRHRQDMQRLRVQQENEKAKKQLPSVKELPPIKKRQVHHQPEPVVQAPVPAIEQPQQQKKATQAIEDRKRRLLQQRQILKKKKIEQRQKQLQNADKSKRPVSINQLQTVQTIVLDSNGINDGSKQEPAAESHQQKISHDEIERRRNLMKRIKNKIIEDI